MVTQGPVTLFGAVATKTGWDEIGPTFDWLASTFSNCESFEYEVVAAGVSDDLAYITGIEHDGVGGQRSARPLLTARDHKPPAGGWRVESRPPAWRSRPRQPLRR